MPITLVVCISLYIDIKLYIPVIHSWFKSWCFLWVVSHFITWTLWMHLDTNVNYSLVLV